eukprot:s955_g9.t1
MTGLLLKPSGEAAQSRAERDEIWLGHFGEQEYGKTLRVEHFLSQKDDGCPGASAIQWDIGPLPTVHGIMDALRQTPTGKAMGLDGIPSEALLADPASMATALHPLFAKAMLQMRQPMQWRGGILYAAYKNKGPANLPESYRSLCVSSSVGKTYHKLLRAAAQPQLQNTPHGLHLGSKRQAPITYAALYLQSHFRRCHGRQCSVGALFLDLKAAYYGVVRETDLQHMMELVTDGGLLAEAEVHPMIVGAVKDMHFRTWFVSQYADGRFLASTTAGRRPAKSWADAIFAYLFSRILDTIAEVANGEGLFGELSHDEEVGPFAGPGDGTPERTDLPQLSYPLARAMD